MRRKPMNDVLLLIPPFAMLAYAAFTDIRKGRADIRVFIALAALGTVMLIIKGEWSPYNPLGLIPGAVMLLLSKVTKEAFGYGDGVLILCLGLITGPAVIFAVTITAMIITVPAAALLLLFGVIRFKDKIPWMPFVAAAYAGVIFL